MLSQIRRFRLIGSVILFGISVFAMASRAGATSSFTVTASASPAQFTVGGVVAQSATVTNASPTPVRTDVVLTINDPSGKQVHSQVCPRQRLRSDVPATLVTKYATDTSSPTGMYPVGLKILASDGSAVYNDNATTTSFQVLLPMVVASTATPSPTPTSSSIYWGAYLDGVPWDMTKLAAYESLVGKRVSIVHYSQFWSENGTMQAFHPETLTAIRSHGSIPMITWPSRDMGGGTNQPAFSLSQIINGAYDSYIRLWASGAKTWRYPFFLRWGYEMNGNWFPWGETANGNRPGQFVAAWRHIHDIFTSAGATNVSWVWCPNVEFAKSTMPSYASLYPGDSFVDWTCLDGYNWGSNYPRNGGWISFANLYTYSYNTIAGLAPIKPLMVGEWASTETGGSKASWITDAMTAQLPRYFPRIKAVVWYNWSVDGMDWPIESSTTASGAYKTAVASSYYASSSFGSLATSPIPAAK